MSIKINGTHVEVHLRVPIVQKVNGYNKSISVQNTILVYFYYFKTLGKYTYSIFNKC